MNYSYIAFKVQQFELEDSVGSLRKIGISGFNVTIPHKVNVIKYLDKLDEDAQKASAVNTVNNENGNFVGYNTDIQGITKPLEKHKVIFNESKILILGAGGACRATLVALSKKNSIKKINIVNRNKEKLSQILNLGHSLGLNCVPLEYEDTKSLRDVSLNSNLIINTTSLGLNNEPSPIKIDYIAKDCFVFDIVYKPLYTNLLQNAKEAKANIIFGYEMLLSQGGEAFRIWTGLNPPFDVMRKALLGKFGEPE